MRAELFEGALLRRFGASRGPKVLCIHGFADDGTAFTPLAGTEFAQEHEVVACDLLGFGASPPLAETTIDACAAFVVRLADALSPDRPVGLVVHSVGSPIAVSAAAVRPNRVGAVLPIEGNLTADDAYFSGRAGGFEDAQAFKAAFGDLVWTMAQENRSMRRYHGAVRLADARSMWHLGRDAARRGAMDGFGHAYLGLASLGIQSLYFWGRHNTPTATAAFVDRHDFANREFAASGHWKSVDAPDDTGTVAREVFRVLK